MRILQHLPRGQRPRSLLGLGFGLALAFSALATATPALAADSVAGSTSQASAESANLQIMRTQRLPKNCKWDTDRAGWVCVKVTSDKKNSTFKTAWSETLINDTGRTASLECQAEKSKTWEFTGSMTITAGANVLFAKVDEQVGFSLAHSRASGRSTKVGIDVPPHGRTLCSRGVYVHKFKGKVSHTRCSSSSCVERKGTFKMSAPSIAAWRLRDL